MDEQALQTGSKSRRGAGTEHAYPNIYVYVPVDPAMRIGVRGGHERDGGCYARLTFSFSSLGFLLSFVFPASPIAVVNGFCLYRIRPSGCPIISPDHPRGFLHLPNTILAPSLAPSLHLPCTHIGFLYLADGASKIVRKRAQSDPNVIPKSCQR